MDKLLESPVILDHLNNQQQEESNLESALKNIGTSLNKADSPSGKRFIQSKRQRKLLGIPLGPETSEIKFKDNMNAQLLEVHDVYSGSGSIAEQITTLNVKGVHDFAKQIEEETIESCRKEIIGLIQVESPLRDLICAVVLDEKHSRGTQQIIIENLQVEIAQYKADLQIYSKENGKLLDRIDSLRKILQEIRTGNGNQAYGVLRIQDSATVEIGQLRGENRVYKSELEKQLDELWLVIAELKDDKANLEDKLDKFDNISRNNLIASEKKAFAQEKITAVRKEEREQLSKVLSTYSFIANELRVYKKKSAEEISLLRRTISSLEDNFSLSIEELKKTKEQIEEFKKINLASTMKLQTILILDSLRFVMPGFYGTFLTGAEIATLTAEFTHSSQTKSIAWNSTFAFFAFSAIIGSYNISRLFYKMTRKIFFNVKKKIFNSSEVNT